MRSNLKTLRRCQYLDISFSTLLKRKLLNFPLELCFYLFRHPGLTLNDNETFLEVPCPTHVD